MVGLVIGRFENLRFEHRKRSTAAIVDAAGRTGMRMWLEHEHPAIARATLRNVRMNVAISLAHKAAFLVMAVTGTATLWMAVLADTGASVIVVGHALRLLRTR